MTPTEQPSSSTGGPWDEGVSLERLRRDLAVFARERDWDKYHTPRNLLLALTGEVGELCECFQWRGEVARGLPGFSAQERQAVAEELSDVLLYLCRLADACHIDLGAAALAKMRKNALKYPAERCRGSSAKYHEYAEQQPAAWGEEEREEREQQARQQAQQGQVEDEEQQHREEEEEQQPAPRGEGQQQQQVPQQCQQGQAQEQPHREEEEEQQPAPRGEGQQQRRQQAQPGKDSGQEWKQPEMAAEGKGRGGQGGS